MSGEGRAVLNEPDPLPAAQDSKVISPQESPEDTKDGCDLSAHPNENPSCATFNGVNPASDKDADVHESPAAGTYLCLFTLTVSKKSVMHSRKHVLPMPCR